jgi:hypothetical protein
MDASDLEQLDSVFVRVAGHAPSWMGCLPVRHALVLCQGSSSPGMTSDANPAVAHYAITVAHF